MWVGFYPLSKGFVEKTSKFMPKQGNRHIIFPQKSPATFVVSRIEYPEEPLATGHIMWL